MTSRKKILLPARCLLNPASRPLPPPRPPTPFPRCLSCSSSPANLEKTFAILIWDLRAASCCESEGRPCWASRWAVCSSTRRARPRRWAAGGPGWGKAKSVIMVYLQGGPSQLDLWDPKENVPDNVRSAFKSIPSKVPGVHVTELLPKFAQITDKLTLIRSMSYTPNGLFNHTAAIYQMNTGWTADKVSPSGQLEPPAPRTIRISARTSSASSRRPCPCFPS